MTPEAWQTVTAIITTFGAVTSAIAVALITGQRGEVKRSADAAEAARDEATVANSNTASISNGFARNTTESLAALRRASIAHEARLAWLTDALGQHLTMHGAVEIIRRHDRAPIPSAWWPPDVEGDVRVGEGDLTPPSDPRDDPGDTSAG